MHANDVAYEMRQALLVSDMSVTPVEITQLGDPANGWPNRDGTQQFLAVCPGSFARGFKVTVEVIDADDVWGADELERRRLTIP
jgi:hypothetical protein